MSSQPVEQSIAKIEERLARNEQVLVAFLERLKKDPRRHWPEVERRYIGLIHKDTDSGYGVSFPDLPGCITAGRTLEEAREMAAEALALHLEGLEEDGAAILPPSSANAIVAHPDAADALAVIVVEALPARSEASVSA